MPSVTDHLSFHYTCSGTPWEDLQDWLSTKDQLTPLTRENAVFGINMKDTKCDLIVNNPTLLEDVFKKTLLDNHLSALRLIDKKYSKSLLTAYGKLQIFEDP